MSQFDVPPSGSRTHIPVLWAKYQALKAALVELDKTRTTNAVGEHTRVAFELNKLEPMTLKLEELANEIAKAPANSYADVRVKAKLLLDHLGDAEPDKLVKEIALSLCSSVLDRT